MDDKQVLVKGLRLELPAGSRFQPFPQVREFVLGQAPIKVVYVGGGLLFPIPKSHAIPCKRLRQDAKGTRRRKCRRGVQ